MNDLLNKKKSNNFIISHKFQSIINNLFENALLFPSISHKKTKVTFFSFSHYLEKYNKKLV